MIKDMCSEAGIGQRTNHSLRATGATALFQANVPERIIQKTTGHGSRDSLQTYERISTKQQQAVSRIMMSGEQQAFQDQNTTNNEPVVSSAVSTVCTNVDSKPASSMGRLFGDLTNCSIGQITINVNPNILPSKKQGNKTGLGEHHESIHTDQYTYLENDSIQ